MLKPLGGAKGKCLKEFSAPQVRGERSDCSYSLVKGDQPRQPAFTTSPKEIVELVWFTCTRTLVLTVGIVYDRVRVGRLWGLFLNSHLVVFD